METRKGWCFVPKKAHDEIMPILEKAFPEGSITDKEHAKLDKKIYKIIMKQVMKSQTRGIDSCL